jgi:3-phosphoshikimate 1-carboxyvinyltransferase
LRLEIGRARSVRGKATVPGDKSISHRALILGSIASGRSRIRNLCPGRDVARTAACMKMCGVAIEANGRGIEVVGRGRKELAEPGNILDCGNSGTTARLLMGLLAGYPFSTLLTGDDSLRERPMGRVKAPLTQMGAHIEGRMGGEKLPLLVRGGRLRGITYEMPVASAQVKSSILLAGLSAEDPTCVIENRKSRDHTERMLAAMGTRIMVAGTRIVLAGNAELAPLDLDVPGDFSSAAFLIALALLLPRGTLTLRNVNTNPTRTGFLTILESMGARVQVEDRTESAREPTGDIVVRHSELTGISVPGELLVSAIDELPLLAVVATQAEGRTTIRGASELRHKETDRIRATVEGLTRMGARIVEEEDGFTVIGPTPLSGAVTNSYGDHRIAMSLAVAGMIAKGKTTITRAECIDISFPGFMRLVKGVLQS